MSELTDREKKRVRSNVRRAKERVATDKRARRLLMQPLETRPIPGGDNDPESMSISEAFGESDAERNT